MTALTIFDFNDPKVRVVFHPARNIGVDVALDRANALAFQIEPEARPVGAKRRRVKICGAVQARDLNQDNARRSVAFPCNNSVRAPGFSPADQGRRPKITAHRFLHNKT